MLAAAAEGQMRRMQQDSTLDNLQLPPGTATASVGALGRVRVVGRGEKVMVLIAGMGFGDEVWSEFMERRTATHRMFAVTLPGFGGTPPLPIPATPSRFADTPWIRSSVAALHTLLDTAHLERVTLVAHWAVATQVALLLALERPDRIEAVVLVGGALNATFPDQSRWTAAQRAASIDALGQRWFRTVTRDTWDDNNFMPHDYSANPRRGLFLWREAQKPLLAVWVRYLLEFYAVDHGPRLAELRVPVLVVHPDFTQPAFHVEAWNYMKGFTVDSWKGVTAPPGMLEFESVAGSRLFLMYDKPEELDRVVDAFLAHVRR
jgi:pimeloyl-ACP methyl ester carboxylesterase